MNFVDCCTNEPEFRICRNCKNIQYKVYRPFLKKMSTFIINVCYRLLFFHYEPRLLTFIIIFWTSNTSVSWSVWLCVCVLDTLTVLCGTIATIVFTTRRTAHCFQHYSYASANYVDYVTSRYPYIWCSRVFQSRLFHPCDLVPRFPFPRFQRWALQQRMNRSKCRLMAAVQSI